MRRVFKYSVISLCVPAAVVVLLLSASLHTFHVLTDETIIAEIRFDETGEQRYLAYLRTGDGCGERVLPVFGDQWRIDAEFLKWKYWALLLGLDSQYRLDRFEGRYRRIGDQNSRPSLAHDLGEDTALDVVTFAEALGPVNFLVDATYGSSTYLDIDTTRIHYVYKTPTGIIARSKPRPVLELLDDGLAIEVRRDCGGERGTWARLAAWTDSAAKRALGARHTTR